jgi:hypothetical protein
MILTFEVVARIGPWSSSSRSEGFLDDTDVPLGISIKLGCLPFFTFAVVPFLCGGFGWEGSRMPAIFSVIEPLILLFDMPKPSDVLFSRAAGATPVLGVTNGNWGLLSLLFLAVALFLVLTFLRLAEGFVSLGCISRLAVDLLSVVLGLFEGPEADTAVASLPFVSFGVGRRSSSQSTS